MAKKTTNSFFRIRKNLIFMNFSIHIRMRFDCRFTDLIGSTPLTGLRLLIVAACSGVANGPAGHAEQDQEIANKLLLMSSNSFLTLLFIYLK